MTVYLFLCYLSMRCSHSVTGTFFLYNSKQSGWSVSAECVVLSYYHEKR